MRPDASLVDGDLRRGVINLRKMPKSQIQDGRYYQASCAERRMPGDGSGTPTGTFKTRSTGSFFCAATCEFS
jgi:hypothetical protein